MSRSEKRTAIPKDVIDQLQIRHTLSGPIDPELEGEVVWMIGYRVPLAPLETYAPVARPAPGGTWRANLYKCAGSSSHPHWLTWSPVDFERPDFHLKQYFGVLRFV